MKLVSIVCLLIITQQVIASHQDTRAYELEYANKNLNVIYRKIMNKLQSSEQFKLRKAQREWIIFRDLDCSWAYGAEPIDCAIERTQTRAKELEETMFFDIQGNYSTIETTR